ncbi:MAG: M20/M25/M40 family metallo-hydrolase [Thermoprotei archaeon]
MKPIIRRRKAFSVMIRVKSEKKRVRGVVKTLKTKAYYPIGQRAHAAYFLAGVDSHPLLSISTFIRENNVYVKELRGEFVKSNVIPPEAEITYVELSSSDTEEEVDVGLTKLLKNLIPLTRTLVRTRAFSEYGVSITPNMYIREDDEHILFLDVRAMSLREDVEEAFTDTLKELLPEAYVEVRTGPGSYLYTPPDSTIVRITNEVLEKHGYEPGVLEGAGASDSRYFTDMGIEIIDFGPRGGNIHGDNEYVLIPDLEKLPSIYTDIAARLNSKA